MFGSQVLKDVDGSNIHAYPPTPLWLHVVTIHYLVDLNCL